MKRYDFRYTTKPWLVTLLFFVYMLVGLGTLVGLFLYFSSIVDFFAIMDGGIPSEELKGLGLFIMAIVLSFAITFGMMRLLHMALFPLLFHRATAELGEDVVVIHTKTADHTLYFSDINQITFSSGETRYQNGDGQKNAAVFFEIHHNSGRKLLFGATTSSGKSAKQDAEYFAFRDDLIKAHFDFRANEKQREVEQGVTAPAEESRSERNNGSYQPSKGQDGYLPQLDEKRKQAILKRGLHAYLKKPKEPIKWATNPLVRMGLVLIVVIIWFASDSRELESSIRAFASPALFVLVAAVVRRLYYGRKNKSVRPTNLKNALEWGEDQYGDMHDVMAEIEEEIRTGQVYLLEDVGVFLTENWLVEFRSSPFIWKIEDIVAMVGVREEPDRKKLLNRNESQYPGIALVINAYNVVQASNSTKRWGILFDLIHEKNPALLINTSEIPVAGGDGETTNVLYAYIRKDLRSIAHALD